MMGGGFFEGGVHEGEPAVALGDTDLEGDVAHAEAWVAALLDVVLGAAEAEDEEVAQPQEVGNVTKPCRVETVLGLVS